jgi:hypothetical protein
MKFRKIVRIVHRDLGYICAALVIIYTVSGVAVNHIDEWNPNYIIENTEASIVPMRDTNLTAEKMQNYIISELSINDSLLNSFRSSPFVIDLFFEGKTVKADLSSGLVKIQVVNDRSVIRESNFLHLNEPKKLWTYIADAFAVSLFFLALTGLFMIRGKNGLTGRGKWLAGIGLLIPVLFWIIYL